MPKITIQNPLGGWAKDNSQSNSAAVQGSQTQYTKSDSISLFRPSMYGFISPGETFNSLSDPATSKTTAMPLNSLTDSSAVNVTSWAVLRNGRLIKIITDVVSASYDPASATTTDYGDIGTYKSGANEYIIWSYNTSTVGNIARIKIDSSGQSDTWFSGLSGSGTLTAGVPLIISTGPISNDIYITNGQYIATADINAGTGDTQALNLGDGWISKSITRYGNYVAIVGNRVVSSANAGGQGRLWLWDGFSPDPNFIYDINENIMTAIINDNGVLKMFGNGKSGTTKAFYFTGQKVDILAESGQIGSAPTHGSVDIFENKVTWVNSVGAIYTLDGNALHCRTKTGVASSMLKNLASTAIYVGSDSSSPPYAIKKLDFTGYVVDADFRTRLLELPYRSNIKNIYVYYAQFASTSSVWVSLFKDFTTLSLGGANDLINTVLNATNDPTATTLKVSKIDCLITDVSSFYMNFRFNHTSTTDTAAVIRMIEIEYDVTNK